MKSSKIVFMLGTVATLIWLAFSVQQIGRSTRTQAKTRIICDRTFPEKSAPEIQKGPVNVEIITIKEKVEGGYDLIGRINESPFGTISSHLWPIRRLPESQGNIDEFGVGSVLGGILKADRSPGIVVEELTIIQDAWTPEWQTRRIFYDCGQHQTYVANTATWEGPVTWLEIDDAKCIWTVP